MPSWIRQFLRSFWLAGRAEGVRPALTLRGLVTGRLWDTIVPEMPIRFRLARDGVRSGDCDRLAATGTRCGDDNVANARRQQMFGLAPRMQFNL
jgi:hypothetical protein